MRIRAGLVATAAALAVVPAAPGVAADTVGARALALTGFDGRVVSVNRDARTFRLRDAERGTVRIRVTRRTRFERVAGFRGVRRGLVIEVLARRGSGGWVAVEVERSGRDRRRDD